MSYLRAIFILLALSVGAFVDLGWGTNGIFTFNQPNGGRFSSKLTIDPEGRIVAVANWGKFTLIRLLTDDESAKPPFSTPGKK